MKTIKQLADELGVSKQAIRKQFDKLPPTSLSTGVNRSWYIDSDGEAILRSLVIQKNDTVDTNLQLFNAELVPTEVSTVDRLVPTEVSTVDKLVPTGVSTKDKLVPTEVSTEGKLVPTGVSTVDKLVPTVDSKLLLDLQHKIEILELESNFYKERVSSSELELARKDEIITEHLSRLAEMSAQMSELTAALLSAQQTAQAAQALHAGTIQAQLGDGSKRGFFSRMFGGGRSRPNRNKSN